MEESLVEERSKHSKETAAQSSATIQNYADFYNTRKDAETMAGFDDFGIQGRGRNHGGIG